MAMAGLKLEKQIENSERAAEKWPEPKRTQLLKEFAEMRKQHKLPPRSSTVPTETKEG
jgi:hypothetical protein